MPTMHGDLYDRELNRFRAAFEKNPKEALSLYGWTLIHSLPLDEKSVAMKKLGFTLQTPADIYNLGIASAKGERWDEAITHFSEAASKDVNLLEAVYNLAVCYAKKGDKAKALATLELYAKSVQDPDDKADANDVIAELRGA
ncbi:MAG: tetratricopeptide repeat protein [Candidatus Sumerlaeia bacterium]|nr:tetratricopeptide repeat protein [Candidatus Sumerlaeia bacterium]